MLGTLIENGRQWPLVLVIGLFALACGSTASPTGPDANAPPELPPVDTPEVAACPTDHVGDDCVPCLGRTGDGGVCSNHGECLLGPDGLALCQCEEGYEGGACSEDIDECLRSPSPCSPDALCANTAGGYNCTCNAGFEGDGHTCTNIDECASKPCGDHGTCTDGMETFDCLCDDDFEGELCETAKILRFVVFADTPYNSSQEGDLISHIDKVNQTASARYAIHLGDIKGGYKAETQKNPCTEDRYTHVADIFHELSMPVFFIPGDNEWNDCADPDVAWGFWWTHLHQFETFWPDAPTVERQAVREENFAWASHGVLLIGINLVGGKTIDQAAWDLRLAQDAEWVTTQLSSKKDDVGAAVLFGHASPTSGKQDLFFDAFIPAAQAFGKPILYMNGDLHKWLVQTPFPLDAPHVTQVQSKGGSAQPVQITVDFSTEDVFEIEPDPFE
jgi:hypothetical protein